MLNSNEIIINMSAFKNDNGFNVAGFSETLAHEIGHTAGLNHYQNYLYDLGLAGNKNSLFAPLYPSLFQSTLSITPYNAMFSQFVSNEYIQRLGLQAESAFLFYL
jgi:hypothetical protein